MSKKPLALNKVWEPKATPEDNFFGAHHLQKAIRSAGRGGGIWGGGGGGVGWVLWGGEMRFFLLNEAGAKNSWGGGGGGQGVSLTLPFVCLLQMVLRHPQFSSLKPEALPKP